MHDTGSEEGSFGFELSDRVVIPGLQLTDKRFVLLFHQLADAVFEGRLFQTLPKKILVGGFFRRDDIPPDKEVRDDMGVLTATVFGLNVIDPIVVADIVVVSRDHRSLSFDSKSVTREIHLFNALRSLAKKAISKGAEAFGRVGDEAEEFAFGRGRGEPSAFLKEGVSVKCGGIGRVHEGVAFSDAGLDRGAKKRVMRTPEDEGVAFVIAQRGEVDL